MMNLCELQPNKEMQIRPPKSMSQRATMVDYRTMWHNWESVPERKTWWPLLEQFELMYNK